MRKKLPIILTECVLLAVYLYVIDMIFGDSFGVNPQKSTYIMGVAVMAGGYVICWLVHRVASKLEESKETAALVSDRDSRSAWKERLESLADNQLLWEVEETESAVTGDRHSGKAGLIRRYLLTVDGEILQLNRRKTERAVEDVAFLERIPYGETFCDITLFLRTASSAEALFDEAQKSWWKDGSVCAEQKVSTPVGEASVRVLEQKKKKQKCILFVLQVADNLYFEGDIPVWEAEEQYKYTDALLKALFQKLERV